MVTKRKDIVESAPHATRELSLADEMDRVFDTLFHRGWMRPFGEMFPDWPLFGRGEFELKMPKVDVIDREKEILVRAELPGVEKQGLEVNLSGQLLTIKGESRREEKETEGEYFRSEISRGSFRRSIRLPEEVDEKGVKAEFKDGLLEVRLPKTHEVERHQIPVE